MNDPVGRLADLQPVAAKRKAKQTHTMASGEKNLRPLITAQSPKIPPTFRAGNSSNLWPILAGTGAVDFVAAGNLEGFPCRFPCTQRILGRERFATELLPPPRSQPIVKTDFHSPEVFWKAALPRPNPHLRRVPPLMPTDAQSLQRPCWGPVSNEPSTGHRLCLGNAVSYGSCRRLWLTEAYGWPRRKIRRRP